MAKSNAASPKSNTHFEQVPIEVVKKIAELEVSKDKKAGTGRSGVDPASSKKR
ncbi:MAG TPA: hypothetical protein VFI56_02480 [Vicinamibacterales bacterium]|nr:hypothetical protein [Vicinamibacterales bacterium]